MTISNIPSNMIAKFIGEDILKGTAQSNSFLWVLETSVMVAILITFVLIVRKPVARYLGSTAAYMLWLLPALRLFMPTLAILQPPVTEQTSLSLTPFETVLIPTSIVQPSQNITSVLFIEVILFIWLSVALIWLGIQYGRQFFYHRDLRHASRPISDEIATQAKNIAHHLGHRRPFRIQIADEEIGPLVTGLINPMIVLPRSFENYYSKQEQALALTHEITHIKRGDLWVMFCAVIFRALNWPNPLVHTLAWRAFRADQEASCDAIVLKLAQQNHQHRKTNPAHTYASALVKAAKNHAFENAQNTNSNNPNRLASNTATSLSLAHEVKERLMLLNSQPTMKRRLTGQAAASALIVTGLLASAQYGYAAQDEKKETPISEVEILADEITVDTSEGGRKLTLRTIVTDDDAVVSDNINSISYKFDGSEIENMFILKEGINCTDTDYMLKKVEFKDNNTGSKDSKKKHKTEIKKEIRVVSVFSGTDENGEEVVITGKEFPKKIAIVCHDGKEITRTISGPEFDSKNLAELKVSEIENLRTAISHLKEEEEKTVQHLRLTVEKLEKRLEELEAAKKKKK